MNRNGLDSTAQQCLLSMRPGVDTVGGFYGSRRSRSDLLIPAGSDIIEGFLDAATISPLRYLAASVRIGRLDLSRLGPGRD
jgi:hypothetical protein